MLEESDFEMPSVDTPIKELLLKIRDDSTASEKAFRERAQQPLPETSRAALLAAAERFRTVATACFAASEAVLAVNAAQRSLDESLSQLAREFSLSISGQAARQRRSG
jgi:ribose 1,5-bisphosphokinase PhnN